MILYCYCDHIMLWIGLEYDVGWCNVSNACLVSFDWLYLCCWLLNLHMIGLLPCAILYLTHFASFSWSVCWKSRSERDRILSSARTGCVSGNLWRHLPRGGIPEECKPIHIGTALLERSWHIADRRCVLRTRGGAIPPRDSSSVS
jgi:hypothetical protein